MPMPLVTTFELLAATRNVHAVDVLLAALDVADDAVRDQAVAALLKRRLPKGVVEIIRRMQTLSSRAREALEKEGGALSRGLNEALLSGDALLRSNALELASRVEDYSQIPALARLLEEGPEHERPVVERALFELVNRLYDHLKFGRDGDAGAFLRDAGRIRTQVLATLEAACNRYSGHRCRQVVEGLLALGDPDNLHLKKLFREAAVEVRAVASELMCTSRHPGVMALVVDSMAQNYPFPAALAACERRTDPEFVCHLLRHWPRKLTPFQHKNFKELRTVAWLELERGLVDAVPPALHRMLIAFVMSTGLAQQQKLAVLEWMVRAGSPEGRLAATDVLVDLEGDKVQEVVLESLESQEPDVQAWATAQLRAWSIPNAMELLVGRLDSPIPEVREAARRELAGFDLYRALDLYDHLDEQMAQEQSQASNGMHQAADDLRKIVDEMSQSIGDMRSSGIRPETIQRQERILSRLLQAEKSVHERDKDQSRESKPGENVVRQSPRELDLGTPEAQKALQEEMLRMRENGFTPDYNALIRKYFEELEKK